jgi:hypothetical protein
MRSSTGRRMMTAPVLVAVLTLGGTTDASAWTTAYGHVGAADRTLRRGCHD